MLALSRLYTVRMETGLDRLVRAMRPVIFVIAVLCIPVFFYSYAKMLALAFDAWSGWAWAATIISHVAVFIAASCLSDHRSESRQPAPLRHLP